MYLAFMKHNLCAVICVSVSAVFYLFCYLVAKCNIYLRHVYLTHYLTIGVHGNMPSTHQVEHDTAQSMQTLLKLDSIKSRMTLAADALKVRLCLSIFFSILFTIEVHTYTHFTTISLSGEFRSNLHCFNLLNP